MHYPYIYRLQRYKKKLNYERNSTLNMLKSISAFNFHPFIIIFSTALLSLLSLFLSLPPFSFQPYSKLHPSKTKTNTLNIQTPNRNNPRNLHIGKSMGLFREFTLEILEITSLPVRARTTRRGKPFFSLSGQTDMGGK